MKKTDCMDKSLSRCAFLAALGLGGAALIAGCSSEAGSVATNTGSAAAGPSNSSTASGAAGSVLVACYSAQGHTKRVAEQLAAALGADLFEIVPSDPYTSEDLNYNDDGSRVCQEYEDESLRDVALEQVTPDGWDGYDTVLLGYPIWWGIAAWPTNRFAGDNDFTGKTVIPFCTSASSGLGDSGELLAELAGTGDWQEGQRFSSSASEDEVSEWAQSL